MSSCCPQIVRSIDSDSDGLVSAEDFKKAFYVDGDEDDILSDMTQTDLAKRDAVVIEQRPIEELSQESDDVDEDILPVPIEIVQQFKVAVEDVSSYREVWTSEGTMARSEVSVWAPDDEEDLTADKVRVCVGHYASQGFGKPASGQMLLVKDGSVGMMTFSSEHMKSVIHTYMPHPKRFKQVWNKQKGNKKFFAWRPISPSSKFVPLGHVCTTTDEEPPTSCVRLVPKKWVVPYQKAPSLVWDDSGTGGRPGSIWSNKQGPVLVTQGHEPPTETRYKLKKKSFAVDPSDVESMKAQPQESEYDVDAVDPGLELSADYEFVWNEDGSGASRDASAWRPKLADGGVWFGDYVHSSDDRPRVGTLMCAADHPRMFAAPESFELVCQKKKGDHKMFGWRAVAPSPQYVQLGDIITTTPQEPTDLPFRCVHKSLLRAVQGRKQIWTDEGGMFSRGEKVAIWESPAMAERVSTMLLVNDFESEPKPTAPRAVGTAGLSKPMFYQLKPAFTPIEARPMAMAVKDYFPEQEPGSDETLLQLKQFEYITILDEHPEAGWWTGYSNRKPGRVGLVPHNYVKRIPTTLCEAQYRWPQVGQPPTDGDLTFEPGQQIIATETNGSWWHGFVKTAPEVNGK
jgi:hypothetical protein